MPRAVGATISYLDSEGSTHRCSLDQAGQVPFEECRPVRHFPAHRKQRHMPGFYWFATTGRHIPYESRLEMTVLVGLDFDQQVIGVSAQPFRFEYGEGRAAGDHVPDFFVALRSGSSRVIDVKPSEHAAGPRAEAIFGRTRRVCDRIGWEYVIASEPEPTIIANLSWLAGYRRRPADPFGLVPLVIDRCSKPTTLRELVGAVGPEALVRPLLFHLLWSQVVTFDAAQALNADSLLHRATERVHAA